MQNIAQVIEIMTVVAATVLIFFLILNVFRIKKLKKMEDSLVRKTEEEGGI